MRQRVSSSRRSPLTSISQSKNLSEEQIIDLAKKLCNSYIKCSTLDEQYFSKFLQETSKADQDVIFNKILNTPDLPEKKSNVVKKKALNYKAQQVTKDLFKTSNFTSNTPIKNP